jgi:hypothetical protein
MKKTNFFYHMLIVLGICGFMFCGENNNNGSDDTKSGNATGAKTDSSHAGELRDPSTAYPQPPVTGTTVDSSHAKDSVKR